MNTTWNVFAINHFSPLTWYKQPIEKNNICDNPPAWLLHPVSLIEVPYDAIVDEWTQRCILLCTWSESTERWCRTIARGYARCNLGVMLKVYPPGHKMEWNSYHRLEDIHDYLDYLAETYPNVCSVVTIGYSIEGRPLKVSASSRCLSFNINLSSMFKFNTLVI